MFTNYKNITVSTLMFFLFNGSAAYATPTNINEPSVCKEVEATYKKICPVLDKKNSKANTSNKTCEFKNSKEARTALKLLDKFKLSDDAYYKSIQEYWLPPANAKKINELLTSEYAHFCYGPTLHILDSAIATQISHPDLKLKQDLIDYQKKEMELTSAESLNNFKVIIIANHIEMLLKSNIPKQSDLGIKKIKEFKQKIQAKLRIQVKKQNQLYKKYGINQTVPENSGKGVAESAETTKKENKIIDAHADEIMKLQNEDRNAAKIAWSELLKIYEEYIKSATILN